MNQISTFTKNPFFTIETSKDSIQKFGYDHIQRMKADNNPHFAQNITDTETCWQGVFGNLNTYDADKNLQQSFTIQVNAKIQEFADKSVELDPHLEIKFGKESGSYQEFFPYGHNEFHHITQETVLRLMERMIAASHKYTVELGATWETEFTQLYNDFKIIFASQKEKKGDVSLGISDFESKRDLLFVQLYKNIGTIIAEYPATPEKLLAFFDETIVNYDNHPGEGDGTGAYVLLATKMSISVADISFSPDDTLLIRSLFDQELKFYFSPQPDIPPAAEPTILPPNGEIEVKCIDAGAPTNKYLIFINGTGTDGEVEITLI